MPGSRREWGWHALSGEWAARVVAASPVGPGDLVLDVGAGTGALTRPLLDSGARVLAVERHPGRADRLRRRFGADLTVLETDLRDLRLPRRPFRVVAAPPYLLTSALVRRLLGTDRLLSADLVLEHGAARRLATRLPPGRGTRRYDAAVGLPVPRRAFRPMPRVDSAVLEVRHR
ncbi:23S rRNA (adenine(2058)-N(6))-methyltransferase Erm(41) [Marmoricola endophyticus]|uniref:23S rRNA (Adenine(2058)-N(6))-methyltransferase Erm(41) n=1 Tax=Marmoricola endophyticus TaxID=2040280 RepID=A0A917BAJ7_9ACTN|nr:rRNA adenine N(6)-methyltransferase family protein [Marmoricola endophyticus]GGF32867.1 23S rRNA (adenine(2058)-N(6))-methyltransferase Erm(41) [Marmoricola endophyticus]